MIQLNNDAQSDEEFLVTSSPTSRLSTLFTDDSSNMISDLKYVAPKQPQNLSIVPQTNVIDSRAANLNVLYASAVSLFSHDQDTVKNFGKVMCCITKDLKDVFAMLFYKTKQQVISQAIIHANFIVVIQPNNYAIFKDDKNIQRSVHINSHFEHFLTQIGICRAFLAFKKKHDLSYFSQDISLGEGAIIEEGDTIKFSFNSWQVENFKRGIQLGTQKDGVKLILSKSIKSWEMGLVGGQIFLRRIIFVPNSQVYASDESSMIAYEVFIEKIYKKDDDNKELQEFGEPSNNADLKKIDESEISSSSTSPSKVSLISRMAKVGQALLPTVHSSYQSSLPTDSESEIEEINDSKSSRTMSFSIEECKANSSQIKRQCDKLNKKLNIDYKHQPSISSTLESSNQRNIHQEDYVPENTRYPTGISGLSQPPYNQYSSLPPGSLVSYHAMPIPQIYQGQHASSSSMEPILSLLLSESRSQNTDMRIALSKLTEKIDQLEAKIKVTNVQDAIDHHSAALLSMSLTRSKFDPKELLHQITCLVEENEKLKQENDKIYKRNDELNSVYAEVMKKNQSLLEEKTELLTQKKDNSSPEKTSISLQEVLIIQEEKVKIKSQLEDVLRVIKSLEDENKITKNSHLNSMQDIDLFRAKLDEEKKARVIFEDKLLLQNEKMTSLEAKIKDLQESCSRLSSTNVEQGILVDNLEKQKKELENKMKLKENEVLKLINENIEYKEKAIDLEKKCRQLNANQLHNMDENSMKTKELSALVKQIMNATYKKFKSLFNIAESYEGKQVLENALTVIRDTTLQYVEKNDNPSTFHLKNHENRIDQQSIANVDKPEVLVAKDAELFTVETKDGYQNLHCCEISQKDSDKITEGTQNFNTEDSASASLHILAEQKEIDCYLDSATCDNADKLLEKNQTLLISYSIKDADCHLSVPKELPITSIPSIDPSNTELTSSQSFANNLLQISLDTNVSTDNYSLHDDKKVIHEDAAVKKDDANLKEIEYKSDSEVLEEIFNKPIVDLPSGSDGVSTEFQTAQISETTEISLYEDCRPIPPPVPSLFSDSDDDDSWLP